MKGYTDLEQSKKLAEILSLETADYFHAPDAGIIITEPYITILNGEKNIPAYDGAIPCWSLAALLNILNKTAYFIDEDASVNLSSYKTIEWDLGIVNSDLEVVTKSNPVDACYEMILKLYEQKLL